MKKIKEIILNILSVIPVEKAIYLIERIRLLRLKKRLLFCGRNVVLNQQFHVDRPEYVYLADDVSFGRSVAIMGAGNTTIGKGTMIATGTKILTTTHDPRAVIMRKTGFHKPVTIGGEVWVGAGAIILPGVTIGDNAIIGAGAVVTN
ncbi:hypothetical protein KA005_11200, partial [bacterium]|nr:hypothetical protein [bacterium]